MGLLSMARHPVRPFLAAALTNGKVQLWGTTHTANWTAFAADFEVGVVNVASRCACSLLVVSLLMLLLSAAIPRVVVVFLLWSTNYRVCFLDVACFDANTWMSDTSKLG